MLPIKYAEDVEKHIGRHFQIEFIPESGNFMIKDLGCGYGAFVRLDFPQVLKDNNLLSAGESFIVVNLIDESAALSPDAADHAPASSVHCAGPKLRLKLFSGPSNGEI